jgi:hypothetical protein
MRQVPSTFPPDDLWTREAAGVRAGHDLPPERLRAIERLVTAGFVVGTAWLLVSRPDVRRLAVESARLALTAGLPVWLAREVREAWRRDGAKPAESPFEP